MEDEVVVEEKEGQGSGGKESGNVAFCGIRGSLCREAFLNFASKLCWGLNSLWRGTRTGGSTESRRSGKDEEKEGTRVIEVETPANHFGSGKLHWIGCPVSNLELITLHY